MKAIALLIGLALLLAFGLSTTVVSAKAAPTEPNVRLIGETPSNSIYRVKVRTETGVYYCVVVEQTEFSYVPAALDCEH